MICSTGARELSLIEQDQVYASARKNRYFSEGNIPVWGTYQIQRYSSQHVGYTWLSPKVYSLSDTISRTIQDKEIKFRFRLWCLQ